MAVTSEQDAVAALTDLFCRSVRQLGRAGAPDTASRLAGRAWWVLHRAGAPEHAEHVNGVMHFLARLPGTEPTAAPTDVPTERTPQ